MAEYSVEELLNVVNSAGTGGGDPRIRAITARIVSDLYRTMKEFNVKWTELAAAVKWLDEVGAGGEFGLLAPGLGLDRLVDILADDEDQLTGNVARAPLAVRRTPRAIQGPLYVPDAPLARGSARLDDGTETGKLLIMQGRVVNPQGTPLADAVVDVWHANPQGFYSHFHPKVTPFNYRRRIQTGPDGRYRFQSLMPAGYGVPPEGPTEKFLDQLGRHGRRPAHIHFMISAPGHTQLTTQVNIPGDRYLDDDFAFATRDELVVELRESTDPKQMAAYGVNSPFTLIEFDFALMSAPVAEEAARA